MTAETSSPDTDGPATRSLTPRQLAWLRSEVADWSSEGLLEPGQADALLGHYRATRRAGTGRLLLGLGAGFLGVGVIWLVAANLDQLSPLARFLLVMLLWLTALTGGEVLASRPAGRSGGGGALVATVRLLAAVLLGALVFQAAQSLQVPAYEPSLLAWWSLGALTHAYAVRSVAPLVVGLVTGTAWFLWQVLELEPSGLAVVLALLAGSGLAVGISAVHPRPLVRFAAPWREVGALLGLAALFVAALPLVTTEDFVWDRWLVVGLVVAGVALVAGTTLARGTARLEPLAAVAAAVAAVGLVLWDTGTDTADVTAADWAHSVLSVGIYVLAAVAVATAGTLRDSRRLTALATAALVVFTTFQSFAVFARIIEGAWLFVVLGLVFLGTGVVFDRARRRVAGVLAAGEVR